MERRSYDPPSSRMARLVFAIAYLRMRQLLRALTGSSNDADQDVERLVLRHWLRVLRRQVSRPRLRRRDRLFPAALSRAFPRARWSSFLVSPQTLLRWHREWYVGSGPTGVPPRAGDRRSAARWES
jgi:hypothetical protein